MAVVFATRDVVLDYVMGFLILVEGPYFNGDYVAVSGHPGVEGVVEEIGLRRTVLRDAMGSSHAVSNGFIRISSNVTRQFSVAVVDLQVLHAGELDRGPGGRRRRSPMTCAPTPTGPTGSRPESATDIFVTGVGMDGASIRLQQRVPTGVQAAVASELRRRLAAALVEESIGTGRWDTPLPIVTQAPHASRDCARPAPQPSVPMNAA